MEHLLTFGDRFHSVLLFREYQMSNHFPKLEFCGH